MNKILFTHGAVTPPDGLEITVDHGEDGALVSLNGRLNIDSSPTLRDRLLDLLREASAKTVIVDLAKVSFVDSSGIATLIEGLKVARNRQVTLRLQGLQGRLLHLFETTGVLALFERDGGRSASSPSKVS